MIVYFSHHKNQMFFEFNFYKILEIENNKYIKNLIEDQ